MRSPTRLVGVPEGSRALRDVLLVAQIGPRHDGVTLSGSRRALRIRRRLDFNKRHADLFLQSVMLPQHWMHVRRSGNKNKCLVHHARRQGKGKGYGAADRTLAIGQVSWHLRLGPLQWASPTLSVVRHIHKGGAPL